MEDLFKGGYNMDLKLNIYNKDREIVKTHTANSYDLMLGTVEDIMGIIDIDKMNDNMEVAKMVVKGYKQLKPFLFDVFPGLTEDELKMVKVKELIPLFIDICKVIVDDLSILQSGN